MILTEHLVYFCAGLVDLRKLVSLNAFQQLTSEERLSLLPFLSEADLKSPDALTSLFNSACV